jgi:DNA-directed RNA polymerase specialized sigma subunit
VDIDRIADLARAAPDLPSEDETLRALAEVIATLDASDRLLLTCWYDDGLPAGEIAALVGLPTAFHVYRRIRAVCRALRRELVARGIDGPE